MEHIIIRPDLVNAIEMHNAYPETFEIPTNEQIENIKIGDGIKACVCGERFWSNVDKIEVLNNEHYYHCTVDNNLLFTIDHGLSYGDKLIIKRENIYSIIND